MTEGEMMREAREGKPQTADKKENERVTRMGSGNIPALVVEFAVPAILGMLVNGAYNIIDSVFLGHGAGEIGLSAVSVATPIMTVFMAISMLMACEVEPCYEETFFTTRFASAMVAGRIRHVESSLAVRKMLVALCMKYMPSEKHEIGGAIEREFDITDVWCIDVERITGKAGRRKPKA